jgi:hypothetical protein
MKDSVLKDKWDVLRREAAQFFKKLTADDLKQIAGSAERFVDVLQRRYRCSRWRAQNMLDSFVSANAYILDA